MAEKWLSSPVLGGIVTARFGAAGPRWTNRHTGMDWGAITGTPIRAMASGTVKQAGWFSNAYGNMVQINHGNGVETWYAHMSRVGNRPVGSLVRRGDIIGFVGSTGNTTGPHVHLEVRKGGSPVDPAPYLGRENASSTAGATTAPSGGELTDVLQGGAFRIGMFVGGVALIGVGLFMLTGGKVF